MRNIPHTNEILKYEREKQGLSVEELANKLGVADSGLVNKWERRIAFPGIQFRLRLCALLQKSPKELWLQKNDPPFWYVPRERYPLFTGREDALVCINNILENADHTRQPLAITGMAGLGKTRLAVEYAYRFCADYHTVLWANAASRDLLLADFVKFAGVLHLPGQDGQDQALAVEAVKHWLEPFKHWLLILDNVEDINIVREFLPSPLLGRVVLTERSWITRPIAHRLELQKMNAVDGTQFLLRRTGAIAEHAPASAASPADLAAAEQLQALMDGLPLALEQAGAYIDEVRSTLPSYLALYKDREASLLQLSQEKSESVYMTFFLSYQKIRLTNQAAADFLHVLAFLQPVDIPDEIITKGAPELGPLLHAAADPLEFDAILKELGRYSLVQRNVLEKTLTIHRLVQVVLREILQADRQLWMERTIRAVNRAFPEVPHTTLQDCQRCLPQAIACAELIEQQVISLPAVAQLFRKIGLYLLEIDQDQQAEPYLKNALTMQKKLVGIEDSSLAVYLNSLAGLYAFRGYYMQAEPLYLQAIAICENADSQLRSVLASNLNDLGRLYHSQGLYKKAESLYLQARDIFEQENGANDYFTAVTLNNLAGLYYDLGRYDEAKILYQRALSTCELVLGEQHLLTATTLNNLAGLYSKQAKYGEAELLFRRALAIREAVRKADHSSVANSLNNLAKLYDDQGKLHEAQLYYQRTLIMRQKTLGPDHLDTIHTQDDLGRVYIKLEEYDQANHLLEMAVGTAERTLGSQHPITLALLESCQLLYKARENVGKV